MGRVDRGLPALGCFIQRLYQNIQLILQRGPEASHGLACQDLRCDPPVLPPL